MSLHTLAHHLQNAGRGEDKVLVHMTPKEVQGLQQLAMAHGGSLTINPETGLAEAGFLSSLLPMVIGAGLTIASGGALSPLMAAGITGAGYGLAKGSLREGLMAGLGAYGGAGLASGLTTAGADVLAAAPSGVPAGTPLPTNTVTPLADVAGSGPLAGGNINAMANTYGQAANAATLSPFNYTQGMNMDPASYASGLTPANTMAQPTTWDKLQAGFKDVTSSGDKAWNFVKQHPGTFAGIGLTALQGMREQNKPSAQDQGLIRPYKFAYNPTGADVQPYSGSGERMYFNPQYTALTPYKAPGPEYAAEGGLMGLRTYAVGGPVETMSAQNAIGNNSMYPQSQLQTSMYSNPMVQRPVPNDVITAGVDAPTNTYTGEPTFADGGTTGGYKYDYDPKTQKFTQTAAPTPTGRGLISRALGNAGVTPYSGNLNNGFLSRLRAAKQPAAPAAPAKPIVTGGVAAPYVPPTQTQQPLQQPINIPAYQTPEQQLGLGGFYDYMNQQMGDMAGYAAGGAASGLGSYSDGGNLLKGPGDGVSDSIPAVIGNRQPARLADGEFVVPARIVSELGNGSTEAGAKRLYAMMERVQRARGKTTGKGKVAVNTKADKYLPA